MIDKNIPKSVVARLPLYLHYLKTLNHGSSATISSATIAKAVGLGEVQVRKDLAMVSGGGKPKVGYYRKELVADVMEVLDCKRVKKAVIVGAGRLGTALLSYEGFGEYNLDIVAAFDVDESKIGGECHGKKIMALSELNSYCKENEVGIGIITVRERDAQTVCDMLIDSGVTAVWSFAPVKLEVPNGIYLKEENLAGNLAVLASNI